MLSQGISAFFVLVAVVFCIVALATPNWIVYKDSSVSYEFDGGIFVGKESDPTGTNTWHYQICTVKSDSGSGGEADITGSECDHLRACQGFGVLAVLCYIIALISIIAIFACKKPALGYVVAVFTIGGGIFGLISMAVFVQNLKPDYDSTNLDPNASSSYGYSFALMVVAWVLAFIDGIIMFVATHQAGSPK